MKSFRGRGFLRAFFYKDYSNSEKIDLGNVSLSSTFESDKSLYVEHPDLKYKQIYVEVISFSSESIFTIKMYPNLIWNKVAMGKEEVFFIENNERKFYGYFNMLPEYDHVNLNIRAQNLFNSTAVIYGKYKILDKSTVDSKDFSDYPNYLNYDVNQTLDNFINHVY